MDFTKKILVVLIIFIFIYIIIRLIIKRIQIKQGYEKEGYENTTTASVQDGYDCAVTIKNDLKNRLKNVQDNSGNYNQGAMYLQNYAIKSSMNTAYNGKDNSTDMINYVLTRGCRFIDFEVYSYKDENEAITAVVSVPKNKDSDKLPLDNTLTISDALYYTNMYAFNTTCPNYGDPLFIQIRPKAKDDIEKKSICENINSAISDNLSPRYSGVVSNGRDISGNTNIKDLMGKIIIVMDRIYVDCSQNINLSNQALSYGLLSPTNEKILKIKDDMYTCDLSGITQVLFEDASFVSFLTNVNSNNLFLKYSTQIVPMMFWNTGGDLCNYETLFNQCGGGIVPLSFIFNKLKKNEIKYIDYPDPLFAFPQYGSKTTTMILIVACLGIIGFIIMKER